MSSVQSSPSGEVSTPQQSSSSQPAVQMYGKYIVGRTLGEGGFSTVKLGTHVDTGAKVALKIMNKGLVNGMSQADRRAITSEIETMQSLQNNSIIKLIDCDWNATYKDESGKNCNAIILILELAPQRELFDFIATTGAFNEKVARTYFRQLVDGVSYMHQQGIIHRDLKPENLLMDGDFRLKIADFGFSKEVMEDDFLLYTEVGTHGYMAPEIFNNTGYDGAKADIWAIGIILFIVVAAFPPLQIASTRDWWYHKLHTNNHPVFWHYHRQQARFSPAFEHLINCILMPNPNRRYGISQIKAHPWYKGPIYTPQELKAEMRVRALRRDGLQSADTQPVAAPADAFSAETMRDMPVAPPVLSRLHHVVPPAHVDMDLSGSFDNDFSFDEDFGSSSESSPPTSPAPLLDTSVACHTSLQSDMKLPALWKALKAAIELVDTECIVEGDNNNEYQIRARMDNSTGTNTVSFVAQIFAESKAQNGFVVELRRCQGTAVDFLCAYHAVLARMHHTLRPRATIDAEAKASKEVKGKEEEEEEANKEEDIQIADSLLEQLAMNLRLNELELMNDSNHSQINSLDSRNSLPEPEEPSFRDLSSMFEVES